MQKARGQALPLAGHGPPTACRQTVSGPVSLPSQGCFSPFPHGTGSLSVIGEYLALGEGPPGFPQGFSCPAVLRNSPREPGRFRLQGCHLLGPGFPTGSARGRVVDSGFGRSCNPGKGDALSGLGSSPFARRYWGNHVCFLFLRVLRWFTSPGGLWPPYRFRGQSLRIAERGYPIGRPPDRSLFAAPRGLSQLTASFLAFRCQGIHCLPLVA
jgi:hypothetical protein